MLAKSPNRSASGGKYACQTVRLKGWELLCDMSGHVGHEMDMKAPQDVPSAKQLSAAPNSTKCVAEHYQQS